MGPEAARSQSSDACLVSSNTKHQGRERQSKLKPQPSARLLAPVRSGVTPPRSQSRSGILRLPAIFAISASLAADVTSQARAESGAIGPPTGSTTRPSTTREPSGLESAGQPPATAVSTRDLRRRRGGGARRAATDDSRDCMGTLQGRRRRRLRASKAAANDSSDCTGTLQDLRPRRGHGVRRTANDSKDCTGRVRRCHGHLVRRTAAHDNNDCTGTLLIHRCLGRGRTKAAAAAGHRLVTKQIRTMVQCHGHCACRKTCHVLAPARIGGECDRPALMTSVGEGPPVRVFPPGHDA